MKNTNNAKYHRHGKKFNNEKFISKTSVNPEITSDATIPDDIIYGKNSVMEALSSEREINKILIGLNGSAIEWYQEY